MKRSNVDVIFNAFPDEGTISFKDIIDKSGKSDRQVHSSLFQLRKEGSIELVERESGGNTTYMKLSKDRKTREYFPKTPVAHKKRNDDPANPIIKEAFTKATKGKKVTFGRRATDEVEVSDIPIKSAAQAMSEFQKSVTVVESQMNTLIKELDRVRKERDELRETLRNFAVNIHNVIEQDKTGNKESA